MKPNLWSNKDECCGCGACYQICPKSAIQMNEDEDGFLFPNVDEKECVGCRKCEKVCPIKQNDLTNCETVNAYALKHKDVTIRKTSSSGGAFTAIYQVFEPDEVYGAAFDDTFELRHICFKGTDLTKLKGSKYLQSNTGKTFQAVKDSLDVGKTILYVGTPCQIAGLYNFIGKRHENLLTCDMVCSGVQSQKHFHTFLNYINSSSLPDSVEFKNKERFGWERSDIVIKYPDSKTYKRLTYTSDSPYMASFLFQGGCRDSCYSCRFAKLNRRSDITLADFWGWRSSVPEWSDNMGISLVIPHSIKGQKIIKDLEQVSDVKEIEISNASINNPNLIQSPVKPASRDDFLYDLKTKNYDEVVKKWLKPRPFYRRLLGILVFKAKRLIGR